MKTGIELIADERKRQVEVETEQGKRTISKNGIITMRKATNKSKTNHSL